MLLTEQVDRLARLTADDGQTLRTEIDSKQVRIVALDLPTSWNLARSDDEFTGRMLAAVNGMLLDMLAAIARKDYVDRRRRQAEGTAKAKAAGRYRGRPEDWQRNDGIAAMLRAGSPWQQIEGAFGCSRSTIAKVKKRWLTQPRPGSENATTKAERPNERAFNAVVQHFQSSFKRGQGVSAHIVPLGGSL